MQVDWEIRESGPSDADRTVLLLPGGLHRSGSYAELMAQPALAGVHLAAVTLPGHGGTPPPTDFSIEHFSRLAAELAADLGCDAVLGFSMGASVALEMVASRAFSGPTVLLGVSLSRQDEPMAVRAIDLLGRGLGALPSVLLLKTIGMATNQVRVPQHRRAELLADFRRNDPRVMRQVFRGYLQYLDRHPSPANQLCDAGVPLWVVHAEKGDGGLTREERRTLEACPLATLITIPGNSFLIPNDESARVADILVDALRSSG